jgi:hypothetical protein
MIIQTREFGYYRNYKEVFDALRKWKSAVEQKYPDIKTAIMYNLAGKRGRVTIQNTYPSMADYERIDAELDNDQEIGAIMEVLYELLEGPPNDQFYKVVI